MKIQYAHDDFGSIVWMNVTGTELLQFHVFLSYLFPFYFLFISCIFAKNKWNKRKYSVPITFLCEHHLKVMKFECSHHFYLMVVWVGSMYSRSVVICVFLPFTLPSDQIGRCRLWVQLLCPDWPHPGLQVCGWAARTGPVLHQRRPRPVLWIWRYCFVSVWNESNWHLRIIMPLAIHYL